MDINHMKNIVILKNLPSNMVEEAFIVLKDNVNAHESNTIMNNLNKNKDIGNKKIKNNTKKEKMDNKEYIIKEAEMIVNDYVSKLEEKSIKSTNEKIKLQEKNKRLKISNLFFILFSIFSIISMIAR